MTTTEPKTASQKLTIKRASIWERSLVVFLGTFAALTLWSIGMYCWVRSDLREVLKGVIETSIKNRVPPARHAPSE